jgi:hypothetical protein
MKPGAGALVLGLIAVAAITRADGVYRKGTHVTQLLRTTTTSADQPLTYPCAAPESLLVVASAARCLRERITRYRVRCAPNRLRGAPRVRRLEQDLLECSQSTSGPGTI